MPDGLNIGALVAWGMVLVLVAGWSIHAAALKRQRGKLRETLSALDSKKRSQSTHYGQITEQFAPFMANWPWDPKGFRFLGTPIDGVQFTDQGIIFVEIKSAQSRLSPVQMQAREHIAAGRIYWHEHRIDVPAELRA